MEENNILSHSFYEIFSWINRDAAGNDTCILCFAVAPDVSPCNPTETINQETSWTFMVVSSAVVSLAALINLSLSLVLGWCWKGSLLWGAPRWLAGLRGSSCGSILDLYLGDVSSEEQLMSSGPQFICSAIPCQKGSYKGDIKQEEQQYQHISGSVSLPPSSSKHILIQDLKHWLMILHETSFLFPKNNVICCKLLVIGDFYDHFKVLKPTPPDTVT